MVRFISIQESWPHLWAIQSPERKTIMRVNQIAKEHKNLQV